MTTSLTKLVPLDRPVEFYIFFVISIEQPRLNLLLFVVLAFMMQARWDLSNRDIVSVCMYNRAQHVSKTICFKPTMLNESAFNTLYSSLMQICFSSVAYRGVSIH
jgi:hypothetical protein